MVALGGEARAVSSPTYVLLHIYATPRMSVFHLDAYRVQGPEDFEAIGFSELLSEGGVVVLEWPGRVEALLPARRINVRITSEGEETRRIEVERMPDGVASNRH